MVRIGALDMLDGVPGTQLWPFVAPLLSDPVRGVRIRAVSLLAAIPAVSQPPADRERFEQAASEFIAAQRLNADRPEALLLRSVTSSPDAVRPQKPRPSSRPRCVSAVNMHPPQSTLPIYTGSWDGNPTAKACYAPHSSPHREMLACTTRWASHSFVSRSSMRQRRNCIARQTLSRTAHVMPMCMPLRCILPGRVSDAIAVLKQNLAQHPHDRDTLSALVAFGASSATLPQHLSTPIWVISGQTRARPDCPRNTKSSSSRDCPISPVIGQSPRISFARKYDDQYDMCECCVC